MGQTVRHTGKGGKLSRFQVPYMWRLSVSIYSNVWSSDSALFVEVSMVMMVYHHVKRAERAVDAFI